VSFLRPVLPPYDALEWQRKPFAEKSRLVCQAWAMQGYGTPVAVYGFYIAKVVFYVGMWAFFCSFTPGLGDPRALSSWWLEPIAFQKFALWSMVFEGLGLGCGSGPLAGRYSPMIGGFLYFLRPGTTKAPLFPGLPIVGRCRRSWLDVALYVAHNVFLIRALISPALTPGLLLPTVILLPLLTLSDKTLFLVARGEHYFSLLVCFLFAEDWIPGSKWVHLAIWFWAAFSKLNHHFPSVIAVMVSNSPFLRFGWLRKRMYRDFPSDLRPSQTAKALSYFGTIVEFSFPLLLAGGSGGWATRLGLAMMLLFHFFITSNVPMGVPIEWNVFMVYGAFFLFGAQSHVSLFDLHSPLLVAYLLVALVLAPLLGNLFPAWVSFLVSMRYYAGNWPYSVWLFRGDSARKLDRRLVKSSGLVLDQLKRLYDEGTAVGLLGKVIAFREMHLHGRALQILLPKAVDRIEEYEYFDGELVAGMVLGWNFGDGHLHDERLLEAIQDQCGFEYGELRCIFVESQPLCRPWLHWRIADAKAGRLDEGTIAIRDLQALQPWASTVRVGEISETMSKKRDAADIQRSD
jgi:Transmembrane protein of unknown function (DUF3556)